MSVTTSSSDVFLPRWKAQEAAAFVVHCISGPKVSFHGGAFAVPVSSSDMLETFCRIRSSHLNQAAWYLKEINEDDTSVPEAQNNGNLNHSYSVVVSGKYRKKRPPL